MNSFKYLGYTFTPYGNIMGKDNNTRFQRLTWRLDTLSPILNKENGYDYYEFNRITGESCVDIYFVEEKKMYYVPIGGGMCRIDITEIKKYIRKIKKV